MLGKHGIGVDADAALAVQLLKGSFPFISFAFTVKNYHQHSVHDVFLSFYWLFVLCCQVSLMAAPAKTLPTAHHDIVDPLPPEAPGTPTSLGTVRLAPGRPMV